MNARRTMLLGFDSSRKVIKKELKFKVASFSHERAQRFSTREAQIRTV